jgi:hypothetical protein
MFSCHQCFTELVKFDIESFSIKKAFIKFRVSGHNNLPCSFNNISLKVSHSNAFVNHFSCIFIQIGNPQIIANESNAHLFVLSQVKIVFKNSILVLLFQKFSNVLLGHH